MPVTLTIHPESARPLPALGLAGAGTWRPVDPTCYRLAELRLGHLRGDVNFAGRRWEHCLRWTGYWPATVRHWGEASGPDLGLELALRFSHDPEMELAAFARYLDELNADLFTPRRFICRLLLDPGASGWPIDKLIPLARILLNETVTLAGAADENGTFAEGLDEVVVPVRLPGTDLDDTGLMASLPDIEESVRQAMAAANGRPVIVSPIEFGYWRKPDPRPSRPLGAAWAVACLRRLAEARASSVTLFRKLGDDGIMAYETMAEGDRHLHVVHPVFEVVRAFGQFAGGEALATTSSDPTAAEVLALQHDGRRAALVANLLPEPQGVTLGWEGGKRALDLDAYEVRTIDL